MPSAAALLVFLTLGPKQNDGGVTRSHDWRHLRAICHGCIHEPLERDYFGLHHDEEIPSSDPPRFKANDLTVEQFDKMARLGKVFVVEEATKGRAMRGWSCDRLAKEFPDAKMRREYDWEHNPTHENRQSMQDIEWETHLEEGDKARERVKDDPKAPPFAPFLWAVREWQTRYDMGTEETKKLKKIVNKTVPYFMNKENGKAMYVNSEFWLGAKGTGTRAHMGSRSGKERPANSQSWANLHRKEGPDSQCLSTVSLTLSGARRFRIGPPPRMPKGAGRSSENLNVFEDGVAYHEHWKPLYEFISKEGDAVFYPPGWIHETLHIAEGCTAALTSQFDFPTPTPYFRNYYNRLRRIGDMQKCWKPMGHWSSLHTQLPGLDTPEVARQFSTQFFHDMGRGRDMEEWIVETDRDFFDMNQDFHVSRQEFVDLFTAVHMTEVAALKEEEVAMPKIDFSFDVDPNPDAEGDVKDEL